MDIKEDFIEFLNNHPSLDKEKPGPKILYANLLDEGSALDINIKSLHIPYYTSGYTCTNEQYWEYVIKPLYVAKFHKDKGSHPMVGGTYWNHLATINKYIEFLKLYGDNYSQDDSIVYSEEKTEISPIHIDEPRQQIFFGAPGTGKSHTIKEACKKYEHFRITFHPDTDYSSFVGAYKPTTTEVVLRDMSGHPIKEDGKIVKEEKISYKFVQQAFMKAYVAAWLEQVKEEPEPVFLVIEEINRGNCAQIFGDIFQLLDRNESGFSDYPIHADTDLSKELKKEFRNLEIANSAGINALYDGKDVTADVKSGKCLLLPNNLYIWATMNTSDQSLFPIDSAFKRRWDWKYIKIADSRKDYRIAVNGKEYDWWEFLKTINEHIGTTTSQEDKKLGYFFAKAPKDANGKNIINADKFLSKVLFFLYGDVYKDYGFDDEIFNGEDGKSMDFSDYFDEKGDAIELKIEKFLQNLKLKPVEPSELAIDANETID